MLEPQAVKVGTVNEDFAVESIAGDIFQLGKEAYKIIYVGSQVQKNLRDLGHITLRFNGNKEGENLEGSLYLEDKEIGDIAPGEEIAIYKR